MRFVLLACAATLLSTSLAVAQAPLATTSAAPAAAGSGEWLSFAAVGDTMLSGSAQEIVDREGFDYPFALTKHFFQAVDLAIANFEAPAGTSGTLYVEKKFRFLQSPAIVPAMKAAGINAVALGNNHMLDYGPSAVDQTRQLLRDNGILFAGYGDNVTEGRKPARKTVKGVNFCMLSYSLVYPEEFWATSNKPGTIFAKDEWLRADIPKYKRECDLLFINFHWGGELKQPRDYQYAVGKLSIDLGADAVIGTHPHIWQPVEVYKGKPIFYSLGNFAFGSYSQSTTESGIALFEMNKQGKLGKLEIVPLDVNNRVVVMQPKPLTDAAGKRIAQKIADLSEPRGAIFEVGDDARARLVRAPGWTPSR